MVQSVRPPLDFEYILLHIVSIFGDIKVGVSHPLAICPACVTAMDLCHWKFRFSLYGGISFIERLMRHAVVVSWECEV